MRCQEVRYWTFKGLVAAFLDLSVAFLLLSVSSLVYLSSNFLGLFGLNLPCPCDGLFSDPYKNKCFQETLGNLPMKKIYAVQKSVKKRTPFDSILYTEENGDCIGKNRKGGCRCDELEGEVSSSPSAEVVNSWLENASGFNLLVSQSSKKGKFKNKRLSFHRSPYELRNCCKDKNLPHSPASIMEYLNDVGEAGERNKQPKRTFSWAGEGTCSSHVDLTYSGITQKTIEIMEQVLVEERAARSALTLELEKERNAAATAADEALSMILRLQEEKASIEMESRQYQRMIEEKSAFDAEEMNILKEILIRREREKYYLEKEVDTYRKMFLETEQPQIERSQTPQQMTDPLDYMETADVSSGDDDDDNTNSPNPGEVDNDEGNKVNGVDQNPEPKVREEGSSFPEPISRSSNIFDSKKLNENFHDIDCQVHDIHVVTDEDSKGQLNACSKNVTRDLKLDRSQSVSDTSYVLPAACQQGERNMTANMRRNSMSAVECERLKIESEVGLLRGRLRDVQKGREKISFSSKEQSRFWVARRSDPLNFSSPSSSTMVKAMSMALELHSA